MLHNQCKIGDLLTWTKKGVAVSYADDMDSALVVEGDILKVVGPAEERFGVPVRSLTDRNKKSSFPANLMYLRKPTKREIKRIAAIGSARAKGKSIPDSLLYPPRWTAKVKVKKVFTRFKKGDKVEFIDQSELKLGFKGTWVLEETPPLGLTFVVARNHVGFCHNISTGAIKKVK